ncbi:MAG: SDR family oxidoreductase [Phenylobacterium sp.]|uniref:SDR family NAD(P)-dependent oxidoreductase n=1 Tax=Phenylobacterium sp. TaxID=1871053 RepID=UPI001A379A94|nr:SDR family oxidoreductase [Phenylobacterium sp.]MBL8772412.1 SDR family oxidoreductase [Phenylobacterium sp.]
MDRMEAGGRFAGKAVLITGAASGIGRGAALRLAAEGADLVAIDLDAAGLEDLAKAVAALGRRCETRAGDVSDLAVVQAALDTAKAAYGGLDGLLNNAGIGGPMRRFETLETDEFDRMVAVNLRPVWYATAKAHPLMAARGGGAILNVASMAGLRPNRNHALYGMTKAAIISLTQHAAMDYAGDNIRVNALCPGPVETPIFEQMRAELGQAGYEAATRRITQRTLMNRFGTVDEQAAAVAWLLSDEAAFVTGVAMPVDGGWSISDGRA